MLRALWVGLFAAAGLLFTPSVHAGGPGKTHAVMVAVAEHSDPQIKPRPFAEADAQALYDLFTNKEYLGIPREQVHLFLGKDDPQRQARPATKDNILAAVRDVVAKAEKEDTVIFVMIGQGAPMGKGTGFTEPTCFLTTDATFKDRAGHALGTNELEQELTKLKAEKLVALLDINFQGIDAGKDVALEANWRDPAKPFVGPEDKEEHTLPPGRVIFLANDGSTTAVDVDGHGLYTHAIIEALKGAADKEGYEPDGVITVDELDTYLDSRIPTLAREHGKTKEQKQMIPLDIGARINRFVFTHNPAAYPKAHERVEKFAKVELPEQVKAQGVKLLERMPKLQADQNLRKLYQQLADGTITADQLLAGREQNLAGRKLDDQTAAQFAQRVTEGLLVVHSGYVKDTEVGELAAAAVKGMYKRLDEKMPDDIKARVDQMKATKDARRQAVESLLTDARTQLGKREDLEGYKDADMAIVQALLTLDFPYTTYIDKESKDKAEIDFRGRFTGIGIQIRRDTIRDGLLVVSPIKGSPGYKAGIKAGDLVTEIVTEMDEKGRPQKEMQTVSTRGMKTEDAVKRILGPARTKVKLKVEREGVKEPLWFEISRGRVEVETVLGTHRNDDDTWDYMFDPKDKIGYIRLTQFTDKSADNMKEAVDKLTAQGMQGLVLDLRFNPGGLLDSAVEICDMFIDDGKIVSIRPRGGKGEKVFGGEHAGSHLNFPMVCLINGESASGSEIVSACLQDHGRARIIGERSFGKGSVQTIHRFRPTEAEIKMTTANFFGPSGKNLNKPSTDGSESSQWGVRPDPNGELKLDRKEKFELFERLRDNEVIPRRDAPAKEPKPAFKDRQLELGLEYLRSQLSTAVKAANK